MSRRVLFIDEDQERNGSTVSLEYLVRGFAEAGYEVFVLTWKYQDWTQERLRQYATLIDGRWGPVTTITLCVHFAYSASLLSLTGFRLFVKDVVKYLCGWFLVRATIRKVRPDLVYVNEYSVVQAAHAARTTGLPVAMHIRSQMAGGLFGLRRRIVSWLVLRYSSVIFPITHLEGAQLRARQDEAKKIHVIGEFVPAPTVRASDMPACRALFGLPATGKVVTMIGGIRELKGSLEFLAAACDVHTGRPDVVFVIAGSDQKDGDDMKRKYYERCMEYVRILQRDGACVLPGPVPNPLELIAASDIIASTARQSHFSRPVVEAWSLEKPVVAVRTPHLEELITDGEDGLLVEAGSARALRVAFERLLDDNALSRRLAEHGRKKMGLEFEAHTNLRRIIGMCEGTLSV